MDQCTTKNANFTDLKYLCKSMECPFQGWFIYIIILIAVYRYIRYTVVDCFNGGGNWNSDEKTTNLPQVTDELYNIMMHRVDLTILLVIGTSLHAQLFTLKAHRACKFKYLQAHHQFYRHEFENYIIDH